MTLITISNVKWFFNIRNHTFLNNYLNIYCNFFLLLLPGSNTTYFDEFAKYVFFIAQYETHLK